MRSSRGCLPPGWCRIEVPRRVSNTSKKYDVYFYTEDGVKLRSFPEIEKCFEEKGKHVERSCFNFTPIQTTATHEFCDIHKTLKHKRYLTVNRERVRKLYLGNSDIVKTSDPRCMPISCTFDGLDSFNLNMAGNDTKMIKNDRGTSKLSHTEVFTPAVTMPCNAVEAFCTEKLSAIQIKTIENYLKHAQMKSDTWVRASVCSVQNPDATTNQPNNYSEQNIIEVHSGHKHIPVTIAENKKGFPPCERIKSSQGSKLVSTNYIPCNSRKRNHNNHCNVAGINVLAERSNKRSKKSAENGKMVRGRRSVGYKKSDHTSISTPQRSGEVLDEVMTLSECEQTSRSNLSQINGKELATSHQKKSQALNSTSRAYIKYAHPKRKKKQDVPTKLHSHKKLTIQEKKANKLGVEGAQNIGGQLHKGSYKLWWKCHRFSNTEKVHFVQKFGKNWTTSYITRCCGKLSGWTRVITQRQSGSSSGMWDVHYVSPRKERFRSKRTIERFIMEQSINIDPELFCFNSSVFDFRVLTASARCNDGVVKKEPPLERMPSSRVSVAENYSKIHSNSSMQSISIKQRKSKQWSSLNSTESVGKGTEMKHAFFSSESGMIEQQSIGNIEFQVEEKGISPVNETKPAMAGDTSYSENSTNELQLQASILAQFGETEKHSCGSDLSQPLTDSDSSNKVPVGCKRTQAESRHYDKCNSSSANQDVAHNVSKSAVRKGYGGLFSTEENALDTIDNGLVDAGRAPTSNPGRADKVCSEHYSTFKSPEKSSSSNLSQGRDFIDSTNSIEKSVKMFSTDECCSSEQIELEDSQYRDSCFRPSETVSNIIDRISTGGNYETNKMFSTSAKEDARNTESNSLIDTDSSNCFSKHFAQNVPTKAFGTKETILNTVESQALVEGLNAGSHQTNMSKPKYLSDLQLSSIFPIEFNAPSLVGGHQDLCNEVKSYSDQCKKNTSSLYVQPLADVENALFALDSKPSHDLWQEHQKTGLCYQQRQATVEDRGYLSKHKLLSYSGCDLKKSCNVSAEESFNATEDSMSTTDLGPSALPGHLKRKINCSEKVLQFFKENARSCKKKSSVATDSFIKRCYPEVGTCKKVFQAIKKPSIVYNGSSIERPIDKDDIVVPNPMTEADSLGQQAVSEVSLHIVNAPFSSSVNSVENMTKKESISYENAEKHIFPNGHYTRAEKEVQEIKLMKSSENFQRDKAFNIALQDEGSFLKSLSQNKSRKRRTEITSRYFNGRQKAKVINKRAKIYAENSDIKSHQIGNETILPFDWGNAESANFCCKCGCVMIDIQALQSLHVCEMCKTRSYSSVAKISHLKNAIHKYTYDSQLFYLASRRHDSFMKEDLSTIPEMSIKYYLQSLGLAPRSVSFSEMAALGKNISYGQLMTHPGAFGSIIEYESKGRESKNFHSIRLSYLDSKEDFQYVSSQPPILHRRLGIQRFILHSSKQLRKSLLGGINSVRYSEDMPAEQLRGKHTQVHYIPPRSPFCLIQEQLYEHPWKLLMACLFLNRTTAKQVFPVIRKFFQFWPDPETTMHADWHEIKAVIKPLGLSEVRAKRIVAFSRDYVQKSWTYPIELYGIGKYGNDSYRIFCLGEWKDVQPTDYKLNLYHEWLVEQNRLGLL